jgi:heptosyltransferase-2
MSARRFGDSATGPGRGGPSQPAAESPSLVIQTAHLGDLVLTLPLLTRLAERHGILDLVTTPAALPLAETHPAVRRAIPFDKHGSARGLPGLVTLGRELRAQRYSQVYLPHGSLRSAVLARLTGAPQRIGFAGTPGSFLYTRRVRRPETGHMTERLLALANGGPLPATPWLTVTDRDRARAAAWLAEAGVSARFIVLAPGARWGTKRWPYFAELGQRLSTAMVVVGGPEDVAIGEAIVERAEGRARSAVGQLALRESAALIERSICVVTNDSLALHLASALGRPAVAIFGPTAPAFGFGPWHTDDRVVELASIPCRPCSLHGPARCPRTHHRCMRDLGVAQVHAVVEQRLQQIGEAGPAAGWR